MVGAWPVSTIHLVPLPAASAAHAPTGLWGLGEGRKARAWAAQRAVRKSRLLLTSPAVLVKHVAAGLQCHCRALREGAMADAALVTVITELVAFPALFAL